MEGYPSREAALSVLLTHEKTGRFLKDLLPAATAGLSPGDRGLAWEMAYGVIRHRALLDYNLGLYAEASIRPPLLKQILRLGIYQLFFLRSVPDYAAVALSVELAKRNIDKHKGGFANAVLKKAAGQGLRYFPDTGLQGLAVNHSHPEWLLVKWERHLGRAALEKALARNNEEAAIWVRRNPARASAEEIETALAEAGMTFFRDPLCPQYYRLETSAASALSSSLFAEGKISFQDPASGLVLRLLQPELSDTLLDLCAAPGGKAAAMAENLSEQAASHPSPHSSAQAPAIVCNDLSWPRLQRMRDNTVRCGHTRLWPVNMDPAHPALKKSFSGILIDAPCSNLGVINRRPEAKWRVSPESLKRQAATQTQLLLQAASLASEDARIVYATCSPEEEETIAVVNAFLSQAPQWRLDNAAGYLPANLVRGGCLWIFPGETDYDGFFGARLVRRERHG